MNVCLFFCSVTSYPSNRFKSDNRLRVCPQLCADLLSTAISNPPKYIRQIPCSALSICRAKNATQSTDGSKIKTPNPHVSFACLDSNTIYYFFSLIKNLSKTGDGCSACLSSNGLSISQNVWPVGHVGVWLCSDFIFSTLLLCQEPKYGKQA
jgi:hypothetical protein